MTKVIIELTDEELTRINGGNTIVKDIQYKDQTLKTVISSASDWGFMAGKNDPGENPIFKPSNPTEE